MTFALYLESAGFTLTLASSNTTEGNTHNTYRNVSQFLWPSASAAIGSVVPALHSVDVASSPIDFGSVSLYEMIIMGQIADHDSPNFSMGGNFENHPGNKTRHADVLNCGVPVLNII
jgi:hypothetical protein